MDIINKIEPSGTQREIKDRLFKAIFGRNNEQSKKWRLELYNALRGTNYTDPDALKINTIENVIYLSMRNDLSFLVDSQMTLFEQQSKYNPNMPLRGLMYFAQLYQILLGRLGKTLHRTTLVKIPYPKFVVFYNGDRETEDRELLRLSDAFEDKEKDGDFEWTAELININSDHNKTLQKNCKPLYDYVRYVSKIKENKKHDMTTEEAVNKAVDWAIKENLLDGFFKIQKEEVLGMSLTEYDEEEYLRDSFQEGVEVGQAEGIQKKAIDDATEFLKENISPEIIAKCVKLPLEQVLELKKSITVPV